MRFRILQTLATLAVALTIACASSGGSASSVPTSGDRSVITEADIATSGTESAYELIQRLRPEYLRTKPAQGNFSSGAIAAPPLALIVNGQNSGELDDLRRIPAISLSRIKYYNIEQAKRKFGMQYMGGAIELTYRTR